MTESGNSWDTVYYNSCFSVDRGDRTLELPPEIESGEMALFICAPNCKKELAFKNKGKSLTQELAEASANHVFSHSLTTFKDELGMISHKKSLITIFGHKHKIKNFIKKLIFFTKKIAMAIYFSSYLGPNC